MVFCSLLSRLFRKKPFYIPHQKFALPYSCIHYSLCSGSPISQLKLFQCCKLLRNKLRKIRFCQVDVLNVVRNIEYKTYLFPIVKLEDKKITLNLRQDNKFLRSPSTLIKCQRFDFDADTIKHDSAAEKQIFYSKFDTSNLRELCIVDGIFTEDELAFLFVDTIVHLAVHRIELLRGDLLVTILTKMPNLEHLSIYDPISFTSASMEAAALVTRPIKKLKNFDIGFISEYCSPSTIAKFVNNQMAPFSRIGLSFQHGVAVCTEHDIYLKVDAALNPQITIFSRGIGF